MILTSHCLELPSVKFKKFLKQKIGLNESAISLGIRQSKIEQAPLSVVLWSFGLIDLKQYEQILQWKKEN